MSAAKIMNLFSQFIETELEQEIDTDSSEWKALAKNVSKLLGKRILRKRTQMLQKNQTVRGFNTAMNTAKHANKK